MDSFRIEGGIPLSGTVAVNGSKNASLPIIFAALLAADSSLIEGVPDLRDTRTAQKLLRGFGVCCKRNGQKLEIDPSTLSNPNAPYDLVRTMRASVLALGPMLAKTGEANIYMPGGCAIGARPIDMHIAGLEAMGARIEVVEGYLQAKAVRLKGCDFEFRKTTVTGTANILMAACLAEGTTVLRNAAVEPEVLDLCGYLQAMGADISWPGNRTVAVRGKKALAGAAYRIAPDRIEAGTFMAAAIATQGGITLANAPVQSCMNVIKTLRRTGARIDCDDGSPIADVHVSMDHRPNPFSVETAPYPGFPTDMQAQLMVLGCVANGVSTIHETIFEGRFLHAVELQRMGANIGLDGSVATVHGGESLTGAHVMATDLRASACLVIAGLSATGTTLVDRVYHLDRGYEALEKRFAALGSRIARVPA